MSKTALWRPRCQRVKMIHVWGERRGSFGELVMQDSSPFLWLEHGGPACQLIAVMDDASSRIYARFVEHDATGENLRTFGGWLRRYGRPLAHYTDKNSIFRSNRPARITEQFQEPSGFDAASTYRYNLSHDALQYAVAFGATMCKYSFVWYTGDSG
jgi:hypothetical protein